MAQKTGPVLLAPNETACIVARIAKPPSRLLQAFSLSAGQPIRRSKESPNR